MTEKTKPAAFAKAVAKSDTVDIDFDGQSPATRALYIGSAGDISVEMAGEQGSSQPETTVVFVGVLTGTLLPIAVTRVNSTGTTASSIVAVW